MDFAPYQDQAPDQERALSPDRGVGAGGRHASRSPAPRSPSTAQRNLADPFLGAGEPYAVGSSSSGAGQGEAEAGRAGIDLFETSLPIRMDYEAMLAYLLLPPAGGVFLLIMEHQSDYVRFHAWQSSLIFSVVFILHLIFSASPALSWILFVLDVLGIAFLTMRAYRDADTLDRFEVPFFGRLASRFVDDE